jgi:GTPase
MARNRQPKIYYATQVGIQPPTIVLFTSEPKDISKPYQRYLLGTFRDQLSFGEVPIKLYLRRRHPADLRDEVSTKSDAKADGHEAGRRTAAPADA